MFRPKNTSVPDLLRDVLPRRTLAGSNPTVATSYGSVQLRAAVLKAGPETNVVKPHTRDEFNDHQKSV